jgi:hypothetical protein
VREAEITSVKLAKLVGEMRALHRAKPSSEPLPPAWQQQPRKFCAPDSNHY